MLEERDYSIKELLALFKAKDKQSLDRKLERYGVEFESSGRGNTRIYTIKNISDPFKVYGILKLGIPAQANFTKILNLYFYFFFCDEFAEKPLIEQEAIMEAEGVPVARKTITKWLNYLEHIDYLSFDRLNCRYYVIQTNPDGSKTYTETDRKTYSTGWKIYFANRDEYGCGGAYYLMRKFLGGHPYKKPTMEMNGIMSSDVNELLDVINNSFLNKEEANSP